MRHNVTPGGLFPNYELPDHTGTPRRLSELQGVVPETLWPLGWFGAAQVKTSITRSLDLGRPPWVVKKHSRLTTHCALRPGLPCSP